MEKQFILAIDQGTTGSTVLVVDVTDPKMTKITGRKTTDFEQHYPKTGWVEHDLEDIWSSVESSAIGAMKQAADSGFSKDKIIAIGITNQRETLCVFDRKTSKPVRKAIVWQCKRSADICTRLKKDGVEELFKKKTGLVLDPYFSGTKITWIMENDQSSADAIKSGKAVMGTIDTYLMHRLSAGEAFVTEASNASRTLAFNIETGCWDDELLKLLKIPSKEVLPEVKPSAGVFGKTKGLGFLPDGIPISGALGDQQAALAGQACFSAGESKCTYGTGAFFLLNTGSELMRSKHGLLTTVAWSLDGKLTYCFEGASFVAGAAVQFLRDQLGMIASAPETEEIAASVEAAPEVYFVPALAGLGAPYWDAAAQGAFLGLTRGTTKEQMVRAVLEGMIFQVGDLAEAMGQDLGKPISILKVDGGASANDLAMQIQADYSDIPVDRPQNLETTAYGAAMFAGLGVGLYSGLEELGNVRKTERVFKATPDAKGVEKRKKWQEGWQRAIKAVRLFADS
jgi:glycerol kinase